jgi:hypothetical protein
MIPCMIRGLAFVSPFIKALNECPVLLAHVSKLAGLPLIPHYSQMQYSHSNFSLVRDGLLTPEEAKANAARKAAEVASGPSSSPRIPTARRALSSSGTAILCRSC